MTRNAPALASTLLLSCALASSARADVRLPALLSDGMVLQREQAVRLWGWADPSEAVRVEASWREGLVSTLADAEGRWSVELHTPVAGGPHSLVVSGKNRIELSDVWSGELWLCSGQSNMEWKLSSGIRDQAEEIAAANDPLLRQFNVQNNYSLEPEEDCNGSWQICTPETAPGFIATGYFFARELRRELDVPVGLIASEWGGTVAESWTSDAGLAPLGDFGPQLARVAQARSGDSAPGESLADLRAAWFADVDARDPAPQGSAGWMDPALDDSAWERIAQPGGWSGDNGAFDGIAWQRFEVVLPESWAGRDCTLHLGPVDDMDTTWFNGARVGGTEEPGRWQQARVYSIAGEHVRAGANSLVVRVLDTGGGGGMYGDAGAVRLELADESESVSIAGDWAFRRGPAVSSLPGYPSSNWFHHNYPTALHNGMIQPLIQATIKGAIWYQGESNVSRHSQYRDLFPAMIRDWRTLWGYDFPFYFVQIAPFAYGGDQGQAAALREAQLLALSVEQTGMACTMDIGEARDIHPRNKQDVGKRLALCALANDYGREVAWRGPHYAAHSVDGAELSLEFEFADGLRALDGELLHFQVAGADRVFMNAEARIEGERVVLRADGVEAPVAARYCWGAADMGTLVNAAGLPASSFRTDDWPIR